MSSCYVADPMSSRPGPLTLLAFACVVLIGGTNFVAVRLSNRELAPSFGAGIRFTFASLLLFAIVGATRTALPRGRALLGTIGYGSLQFFVAYAFVYWGLQHAPAALAGVLFGTVPLFTLVLAVLHGVERFRWRALAGAAIAIAGVAVMAWSPDNAEVPIVAVVALVVSVLGASEATVLVKQLPPIHPFALNAVAMAAGGPLLLALSLVTGEEWSLPERAATWWTLAFLIPIGSVLLFVLFVFVVHRWTASGASYQFVLFPVVSALMGALIADEPLRASIALGGGLVIAGTYVGALSSVDRTAGARPPPTPVERPASVDDGLSLRRYVTVDEFEDQARAFLLEREAEHNLFLGICSQIRSGRYTDFYLSTVERHGDVVGAAFRTPPFNIGLSQVGERQVIESIANDVRGVFDSLPGVLGSTDDASAFAEIWHGLTGHTPTIAMRQRIYQASEVRAPVGVRGELRPATRNERDLVASWLRAFNDEALDPDAPARSADAERLADYRLSTADAPIALWWTDRPVSMAGAGGPTPNGIRVNAVYTPPELRRRGYASACVAALTQQLLDEGRRFCFLYTDLANPTSNAIYQAIGYRAVCDVDQYRFD